MNICTIGAGAWGTTLSMMASLNNESVKLWSYEEEVVKDINESHENQRYLPGIVLDKKIMAFGGEIRVPENCQLLILAVPSSFLRRTIANIKGLESGDFSVVVATKGIEEKTGLLPTQVLSHEGGIDKQRILALSGPNLAREIAVGKPSAAVIAGQRKRADAIRDCLSGPIFRLYSNEDALGVQLGGALKNVIAIAAGICDGMGLGTNSKSALITRGLAEITRLGVAIGANPVTFSGLSGLGDLVATSFSELSRNRTFGQAIARGGNPQALIKASQSAVEGFFTVGPAISLAEKHGVELPVSKQVYDILFEDKPPLQTIRLLMDRMPCHE